MTKQKFCELEKKLSRSVGRIIYRRLNAEDAIIGKIVNLGFSKNWKVKKIIKDR